MIESPGFFRGTLTTPQDSTLFVRFPPLDGED
jgi:hypothetical protein